MYKSEVSIVRSEFTNNPVKGPQTITLTLGSFQSSPQILSLDIGFDICFHIQLEYYNIDQVYRALI